MDNRMMTRDEVAGFLGVSPSTLAVMINEKAFPPPIHLSKSARTDRWPTSVVNEWVRQRQSDACGGSAATPNTDALGGRQFFTVPEIGDRVGASARQVFKTLIACGLLEEGTDEQTRYRPTYEAFERGLFWRVEKFLFRDKKLYIQTVVPVRSIDEVVAIVRRALSDGKRAKQ